jgi:hypothetical protein
MPHEESIGAPLLEDEGALISLLDVSTISYGAGSGPWRMARWPGDGSWLAASASHTHALSTFSLRFLFKLADSLDLIRAAGPFNLEPAPGASIEYRMFKRGRGHNPRCRRR